MHSFDAFVTSKLKVRWYIRYADDFVFLSEDRVYLESLLPRITDFLGDELALELHPNKVSLKTFASGIDFLGWQHFPNHRVLRTKTKRRALANLSQAATEPVLRAYLGLMSHGDTYGLRTEIKNSYWLNNSPTTVGLEQADEQG
jgi:hypothetical protein